MLTKKVIFPDGVTALLPDDMDLRFPQTSTLPLESQHFLIEIPWIDDYFKLVPSDLLPFFKFILPRLHARTTDVHTAICLSMLDDFSNHLKLSFRQRYLVGIALILHDVGWSTLAQEEVAASLGVKGLKLSKSASQPKEKHALVGSQIASQVLSQFSFDLTPDITSEEKDLIIKCVLFHDKPWEVAGMNLPLEVKALVDLDHIWSFTRQNFWQDTVRKGVKPADYLENLRQDLPSYFVTEFGRQKAMQMLEQRSLESLFVLI